MRCTSHMMVGVWLVSACLFTGCRTPGKPERITADESDRPLALSPEGEKLADALAYYSSGLLHEYQNDFDAAFTNYQLAIDKDPDNEELSLRMAVGLLQQKKNRQAIDLLEVFLKRKPDSRKALLWLALIYRAAGQTDQVEATYRRMIKVLPSDAAGYIELATLLTSQGRDEDAIRLLEDAQRKVDKPSDILRALGTVYLQRSVTRVTTTEEKSNRRHAIRIFEQLAEDNPDDIAVLYQLGDLYILDQQIEKAIECFEIIEARNPNNLQIKQKLALSFVAVGDREKAIEMLEKIADKRPDNPRVFYYLGELYQESGNREKAILNYEFATKADPQEPSPFLKLALLYLEKESDRSISVLQEGLKQSFDNPPLHEMLAYVYVSRKEFAEAANSFAEARTQYLRKNPEQLSPALLFNYAVALQKSGDPREAARQLAQAMESNPAFLEAYTQFALRQSDDDGIRETLDVLGHLENERPKDYAILVQSGYLRSAIKDFTNAVVDFAKAEKRMEEAADREALSNAAFYFWYGAACERIGQFEQAESLFEKSLTYDAENPEPYNYLAYMWAERGVNLDKALMYIKKALAVMPDNGAFVDTLGWVYFMQERHEDALREIERARELLPDDPTITEHLGDILFKLGRKKDAVTAWTQSYLLAPDNESLTKKLEDNQIAIEPLKKQAEERREAMQKEETKPAGSEAPLDELPLLLPEGLLPEPESEDMPAPVIE